MGTVATFPGAQPTSPGPPSPYSATSYSAYRSVSPSAPSAYGDDASDYGGGTGVGGPFAPTSVPYSASVPYSQYPSRLYPPYMYGYYGYPQLARENAPGAIGAFICGLIGLVVCLPVSIPAVILGVSARKKIKESGGMYDGNGFATAGLVMGIVALSIFALYLLLIVFALAIGPDSGV